MEMVILTPLSEVYNGVVVVQDRVVVCEQSEDGYVIGVFEVCGSGWWAGAVIGVEDVEKMGLAHNSVVLWC